MCALSGGQLIFRALPGCNSGELGKQCSPRDCRRNRGTPGVRNPSTLSVSAERARLTSPSCLSMMDKVRTNTAPP